MKKELILAIIEDNAEIYPQYIRDQLKDMMKFANNIKTISPNSCECYKKFKGDILKVCEKYEKLLKTEAIKTIKGSQKRK